jgi:hypothetical protein
MSNGLPVGLCRDGTKGFSSPGFGCNDDTKGKERGCAMELGTSIAYMSLESSRTEARALHLVVVDHP